jgi:hypothetical protein
MASKLKDQLNSRYFEAANRLKSKKARRRIVAYVESYDDIYFWRTVLSRFEDDKRYFEVMLPSHQKLERGKKSVLMNFVGEKVGPDMIACVDADYDYMLQGATSQSQRVLNSGYVFHTYAYAIENLQCFASSLHEVCVSVTLNDHRIFDFEDYLTQYSEAIFPLFVWSVWAYRTGNYNRFTMTDFARIIDPGKFNVLDPQPSLDHLRSKVGRKVKQLQLEFPGTKTEYLDTKYSIKALGVTPQTTYLYIQGHHLFDNVVVPILNKVCNRLRMERQEEIYHTAVHHEQRRNEMSCYEHSLQDIRQMLKKNTGYRQSEQYQRIQQDVEHYLTSVVLPEGVSKQD